jgi:choline dehydrogenase-like flavoprotein
MSLEKVNAVIVGAGAGGGIVAKELSEAGLSSVLLERGLHQSFADHGSDELISQRTTVLGNAFGPDDERHRRVAQNDDGSWHVVLPSQWDYNNVAACVGGGTLSYGAMAWRFMPQDFKMRSTYGTVEGSTLEDWPLSYQDLEPYYEKAEWEIGVAGDDTRNPFAPPRRKPYPMPAFEYNREGRTFAEATARLGYHPFPIPMLRNSIEYNGRPACMHVRHCVGFACLFDAKNGTHNTVIPRAIETGLCQLRTGAMASRIEIDSRGRAQGIHYFDEDGHEQYQPADVVVVSASATETPRLLLNSKSRLFPNGAGNNHDWVGRNLQGHAYTGASGLFARELYDDDGGPGACIAICDFNHGNEGLIGGAMLCNPFITLPYLFSRYRPPGEPRWGLAHKQFQREYYKKFSMFRGPVQEMPVFQSRVELDPAVKDDWGIPTLRLSGRPHPHDREVARFIATQADEILKEAGAIRTWANLPGTGGPSGGQHQAGTCRMGDDPKTSVTNRYGQVHEIDNLFIADASLHVTNGGFNPVLTIMALGYWVADYIKTEWKGTRFR